MIWINILVEGQTEETFVRDVLEPHLFKFQIFPSVELITTKRMKSGPDFKGGIIPYAQINRDIKPLLNDANASAVTTMFDYYGLPNDFPGRASPKGCNCFERVAHVEEEFAKAINNPKFIPYLQLHEFEALLFTRPEVIPTAFPGFDKEKELKNIRASFNSPEEIDDDPNTAPSKRLEYLFRGYKKLLHGPLVAKKIGLDNIRRECAHFNQWLTRLEQLVS